MCALWFTTLFFPIGKLMGTTKSNTSKTRSDQQKLISDLESALKKTSHEKKTLILLKMQIKETKKRM